MSDIIKTLKEMGCDMDAAMDRFLNDEEFYQDCLVQVLQEDTYEKLGDALKEGNTEAGFEYAHSLKGVLANLGLNPLLDLVVEIVEPLRKGSCDGLVPVYEKLIEERDNLIRLVEA